MPLCAGKISCYVKRKCKSELEYPCISPQFTLLEHYPITSNPTSVFFTPFLAAASLSLFRLCPLPILACGVKITHSILGRGVPRTREAWARGAPSGGIPGRGVGPPGRGVPRLRQAWVRGARARGAPEA